MARRLRIEKAGGRFHATARGNERRNLYRDERQARKLARPVAWPGIISALEQARGEKWTQFSVRHGDWGPDAALWIGRRQGPLPLARLGELAGGMDYAAVSVAVRRLGQRIASDTTLRRKLDKIEREMFNVEMRP